MPSVSSSITPTCPCRGCGSRSTRRRTIGRVTTRRSTWRLFDVQPDAAVLRQAPLGDVEVGHDLHARDEALDELLGHGRRVAATTPSTRKRTFISPRRGSKWMSEAPRSTASAITEWTSLTTGASSADSRSSSGSSSSSSSTASPTASAQVALAAGHGEDVLDRRDRSAQLQAGAHLEVVDREDVGRDRPSRPAACPRRGTRRAARGGGGPCRAAPGRRRPCRPGRRSGRRGRGRSARPGRARAGSACTVPLLDEHAPDGLADLAALLDRRLDRLAASRSRGRRRCRRYGDRTCAAWWAASGRAESGASAVSGGFTVVVQGSPGRGSLSAGWTFV